MDTITLEQPTTTAQTIASNSWTYQDTSSWAVVLGQYDGADEELAYSGWTCEVDRAWERRMIVRYGKWPVNVQFPYRRRQNNCVLVKILRMDVELEVCGGLFVNAEAAFDPLFYNWENCSLHGHRDDGALNRKTAVLYHGEYEKPSTGRGQRVRVENTIQEPLATKYPRAFRMLTRHEWQEGFSVLSNTQKKQTGVSNYLEPLRADDRPIRVGIGYEMMNSSKKDLLSTSAPLNRKQQDERAAQWVAIQAAEKAQMRFFLATGQVVGKIKSRTRRAIKRSEEFGFPPQRKS